MRKQITQIFNSAIILLKILWVLDYFFLSAIIVKKHNKAIKNANLTATA